MHQSKHLHSVVSTIGLWNFAFTHSLLKAWGCWWVTPIMHQSKHLHSVVSTIGLWNFAFTHSLLKA